MPVNKNSRRDFLLGTGLGALPAFAQMPKGAAICLVLDPSDPVVSAAPAQWAAQQLEEALRAAGYLVNRKDHPSQANRHEFRIVASGRTAPISMPVAPESLALLPSKGALLAAGADSRGLAYALCELAARLRLAPASALQIDRSIVEQPANPVRSVMRQFTSELLDKPWFYDREMWPRYLNMLASHRFNRFHLAFGLGYDTLRQIADSYFLFLYPFLLSLPDYGVRATNLSGAERERNLETLRFIGEQTVARGIDFQLGIWMHGYRWPDSPRAQNTIEGLTAENHAPYCRDALTALLRACPAISSVALRIHGESGVAEGSYDFWKAVFDGVKRCGRIVEIDLHAKGIDAAMIDAALATGMPVNLSPKYWAEHLGMPYHQAAIRDLEMPVPGHAGAGLMTLSEGARVFTRYGYADLLREDRKYTVRHRVFSGTQRILLWGDPASAAAYSRTFQFCGSTGVDLMEPLTCRGRRGSGAPGTRTGYADKRLEPRWDWEKYNYWYRVWGRLLYNPQTQLSGNPQANALESALAHASRILPIVTTAHLPSAACDAYWPEIYWNQPMVEEAQPNPYSDSPAPKTFQNVSPLDPQLFSRMTDFAADLLKGEQSGKYSPVEVAQWLDTFAAAAERDLLRAGTPAVPDSIRTAVDVEMQAALGHFFAAKFRSGVLYAIHERTGDREALEQALKAYRAARAMWVRLAGRAKGVYAADLSVSDRFSERGQWQDRLPGIEEDIARMEQRLPAAQPVNSPQVAAAIAKVLQPSRRESPACTHHPPSSFRLKEKVDLEIAVPASVISVRLYYRHVNQAERFETLEMQPRGNLYRAAIPAAYTDSPYSLQYYFELKERTDKAWLYPGFAPDLLNQPYFVLRNPAQTSVNPETVVVHNGAVPLHAMLWRPPGRGPFPAVLFNHGSGRSGEELERLGPYQHNAEILGPLFARHGYVFLYLFRHGVGPSADQGASAADLMNSESAAHGPAARNALQLQLLENRDLAGAMSGVKFLRALPYVDARDVAAIGHSFGGSLTLLLAEREPNLRAVIIFSAAGYSFDRSPELRARLLTAIDHIAAPVFFIHAGNDYSLSSGKVLDARRERIGKPHRLKIYPPIGHTADDGHDFIHLGVSAWEPDVFAFLQENMKLPAPRHVQIDHR